MKVTEQEEQYQLTDYLLDKLYSQEFKCFYTGRNLVAGINLSLEHKLPKSLYPELNKELSNLCWCDKSVNIAKSDLLPQQFFELCLNVVNYKGEFFNE